MEIPDDGKGEGFAATPGAAFEDSWSLSDRGEGGSFVPAGTKT